MQKMAGTCYIQVDGTTLEIKGKAEYPLNIVMRETVMALGGPSGYSEKAQEPYISLDANMPPNFPRSQLQNMTNGTVTFEAANGQVYTLTQAFLSGETPINSVEGSVELRFSGLFGSYS